MQSFRECETERLFPRQAHRRGAPSIVGVALCRLLILDAADRLQDILVPSGNRREKLRYDPEGQYSIRVNDQWRICFRWQAGDADDVEIVDDHSE